MSHSARIYGIVRPIGQVDGFCIPVFKDMERSNHLLVQVVDGANRIEAFEPFFSTAQINPIDVDITKRIGDAALWYFELKAGPLFGQIDDIRTQFSKRRKEIEESPNAWLQILTACQLEGQEAAAQKVRESLVGNVGRAGATAWLDTNILTPRIRSLLHRSSRKRSSRFEYLTSNVLAITTGDTTSVLVPEELKNEVGDHRWRDVTNDLASYLKVFDLRFSELIFSKAGTSKGLAPSPVPLLKREAVLAFATKRSVVMRQISKSYFEDPTGALRVVCTFSSRYEGKGKRKYWFGYHEIWNQWLEGSKNSFLLLGCIDTQLCFALPLNFLRSQLPYLRSTGTGKDKYWHLDLVDLGTEKNLLDIPRRQQAISLAPHMFQF